MNPKAIMIAMLFMSPSPIAMKEFEKQLDLTKEQVRKAVDELMAEYNQEASPLHLIVLGDRLELVTNPALAEALPASKSYKTGAELTQPQLETVSIIAYKGPISKAEIEHIRGINCSVILRNLLIRGMIEEVAREADLLPKYQLTHDALRHMGVHSLTELPNYEEHASNQKIDQLIDAIEDYA